VSEINLGLYRTFVQPWVRPWANEGLAEWMRRLHPLRLQYEMFSRTNPFTKLFSSAVADVEKSRKPVLDDNIFWQAQQQFAKWMETSLDAYRDLRDHTQEALFNAVYGSPLLQALVGLKASDAPVRHKPGEDAGHQALVARRIEELKSGITEGGPREAVIRALLYIRMPEGVVDERGFNLMRHMREEAGKGLILATFKKLVREQFFMLLLDEHRAIDAIPAMLAKDPRLANRMAAKLRELIDVVGLTSGEAKTRLATVEALFERGGVPRSQADEEKEEAPETTRRARAH
jgi:hypothetical protein